MSDATLEDVRLLTIADFDRKSPFLLLLAGQPGIDDRLAEEAAAELPRAFLRRCLVLQLEYPPADDSNRFNQWLQQRGEIHFPPARCDKRVLLSAAKLIRADRLATEYGAIRPGLAEYIDLLKVVTELHPGDRDAQLVSMDDLSQFVRKKQGKVF